MHNAGRITSIDRSNLNGIDLDGLAGARGSEEEGIPRFGVTPQPDKRWAGAGYRDADPTDSDDEHETHEPFHIASAAQIGLLTIKIARVSTLVHHEVPVF